MYSVSLKRVKWISTFVTIKQYVQNDLYSRRLKWYCTSSQTELRRLGFTCKYWILVKYRKRCCLAVTESEPINNQINSWKVVRNEEGRMKLHRQIRISEYIIITTFSYKLTNERFVTGSLQYGLAMYTWANVSLKDIFWESFVQ